SEKMAGALEELPARFGLLTYMPDRRRDFYGWPVVRRIAEQLPEVEIVAAGGAAEPGAPSNVRFTGLVDGAAMARLYRETSALVRPTSHDGLSQMVLEALLRGRQVVWSRRFPHCRHASSAEEFVAAAAALATDCPPNVAGSRYVQEHYSAEAAARALASAYATLPPP
ncbi:MAG: glycosyltransferase, partial [Candidatus Coatesbacteria bacterium]